VNSAHCELATRLVKSGALGGPATDRLLLGLAAPSGPGGGGSGGAATAAQQQQQQQQQEEEEEGGQWQQQHPQQPCVWSDLTIPVLAAALGALAGGAGGRGLLGPATAAALVERLAAVVAGAQAMRASLKVSLFFGGGRHARLLFF